MKKQLSGSNGKKIAAAAVIVVFVIYRFFLSGLICRKIAEDSVAEPAPRGRITVWDIPLTTVTGSKYAFLETVTRAFSRGRSGVSVNLYKLSLLSPEETIANNIETANRPDVIRETIGGYSADRRRLLCDEETAAKLNKRYLPFIKNDYGSSLIVDIAYNISVILINNEAAAALGVEIPADVGSKEGFAAFLETLSQANSGNSIEIMVMDKNDVYSYLPFLLGSASAADEAYLTLIGRYVSPTVTPTSDFYEGKAVVMCGSLAEAGYITRKQLAGKGFDFSLINYPSSEPFVLVRDMISYAIFDSGDAEKNRLLCEFAEYLLSEESLQYTENIGRLCTVKNNIAYEKYPYLKSFADDAVITYSFRDADIAALAKEYGDFWGY